MELDLTHKPLMKSLTALISAVELYTEVVGSKPPRIQMTKAQYDWYVDLLRKYAEEINWNIKYVRLDEPTFRSIRVYYLIQND